MKTIGEWVRRAKQVAEPDRLLQTSLDALIEGVAMRAALAPEAPRRKPGDPLRLLLAGYNGTRNTGADVRVEEMIRQLRHIFGDDLLELALMTQDPQRSATYFRGVRQVVLPQVFPPFLARECPQHDGVVACEGSMFKSKFANALTTMMAGALGMANAEGKLSVGYGAEAGHMSDDMRRFVRRHCRDSLVLCRNQPSQALLEDLGVRTGPGADTAWTFRPAPVEVAEAELERAGLDLGRPLLAICPVDPFCWPVKPDLRRAFEATTGAPDPDHYRSIYFHTRTPEGQAKLALYVGAMARAAEQAREAGWQPVLVGMEALDRGACEAVAAAMDTPAPLFVSDTHDMYTLVALLRRCDAMITSRFHAMVCAMPAGVPGIGVTIDERIANLMEERGHERWLLQVDSEGLEERLGAALAELLPAARELRPVIRAACRPHLQRMGEMGRRFREEVRAHYPDIPSLVPDDASWEAWLPPMGRETLALLEEDGMGGVRVAGNGLANGAALRTYRTDEHPKSHVHSSSYP